MNVNSNISLEAQSLNLLFVRVLWLIDIEIVKLDFHSLLASAGEVVETVEIGRVRFRVVRRG